MQNTLLKMILPVVVMAVGAMAETIGPFTSTPASGAAPTCNAPVLFQRFPSAVFGKTVYLAVWADGEKTPLRKSTDIYCARIDSATGQSLDPAGILICNADYNQSHPMVAFDGTNFLVVWEDFRSNRDYDIYGARVSESGQVLDPGGFPISTLRDTNAVRPVVGFANGGYLVAWLDARRYPVYGIWGARVTVSGQILDPAGMMIDAETQANIDLKKPANGRWDSYAKDMWWDGLASNYSVNIASTASGCYLSYVNFTSSGKMFHYYTLRTCKIDPQTGQFLISPQIDKGIRCLFDASAITATPTGIAVNLALSSPGFSHSIQGFCQRFDTNLVMLDTVVMSGSYINPQPRLIILDTLGIGGVNSVRGENFVPRFSIAFDGKNIVNFMEHSWYKDKTTLAKGIIISRSSLTEYALLETDTTLIVVDENSGPVGKTGVDISWPYAATGPNNTCILLYEKCIGVDNRQAVCRILREN